jgi:SAM-dependent methyltransferase
MANGTGWERSRRMHFDEIVENYDKARWDYPNELYEDIFKYCGAGRKAIEIGAGTGRATIPFLANGYDVTAIEMGANMVRFLMQKFGGNKNFRVINDTFENASMGGENYDIIYAASAFHWVDAEIGCPKVFQLLKNGGTFALFRNNAMPADGEALYEEIQSVYEKYYRSYYTSNKPLVKKTVEDFWKPSEIHTSFRFESMERYDFRDVTMKFYNESRTYNADEYITLLDTYSDHRALPECNRVGLYAGVKEAIVRHGGQHTLDCIFQLYMGRK